MYNHWGQLCMRHAMIKIKEKRKVFMIAGVITILILLGTIVYFSYNKQYDRRISEIEKDENDRKEVYMKFEELYKSIETELNGVVEELKNEGFYELNSLMYIVSFNEKSIKQREIEGRILCYFDGDTLLVKNKFERGLINLNNNEMLKKLLKEVQRKGIVTEIIISDLKISFEIDTKYTSFVKDNNITNSAVYCEDEDCQKYGYYKIRKNWYLRIPPRPE